MDKKAVSPDSSTQITEKKKKSKKRKHKHRCFFFFENIKFNDNIFLCSLN